MTERICRFRVVVAAVVIFVVFHCFCDTLNTLEYIDFWAFHFVLNIQ